MESLACAGPTWSAVGIEADEGGADGGCAPSFSAISGTRCSTGSRTVTHREHHQPQFRLLWVCRAHNFWEFGSLRRSMGDLVGDFSGTGMCIYSGKGFDSNF
jgi:hypothetical protein